MSSCKQVYLVLNRPKTQTRQLEQKLIYLKSEPGPKIKSTKRIKSADGFTENASKRNKLKDDQTVKN